MTKEEILDEALHDVPGYEGVLKANMKGEVWMCEKTWLSGRWVTRTNQERVIKGSINKGYLVFGLRINGVYKNFKVHRVVAMTFIPNPHNKPQVNHKDGDKLNNNVSNLEWATSGENLKHAHDIGLKISAKGEKNGGSKFTNEQVLAIRQSPLSEYELAKIYGVAHGTIGSIKRKQSWSHL